MTSHEHLWGDGPIRSHHFGTTKIYYCANCNAVKVRLETHTDHNDHYLGEESVIREVIVEGLPEEPS